MLQGGQLHRRFSGHVAAMRQASFPALNLLRGATSYPMATTPPAAAAVSAFESEASASHTDASSDFSFPQALSANDKHPAQQEAVRHLCAALAPPFQIGGGRLLLRLRGRLAACV